MLGHWAISNSDFQRECWDIPKLISWTFRGELSVC
jgi:hypothetical protein